MYNTAIYRLRHIENDKGCLTIAESKNDVPFDIKRVYTITNVPTEEKRGFHAHSRLHQILICLSGSLKIFLDNGNETKTILLDKPYEGLYIGPMIWREMYDFESNTALMVLASDYYNEDEYIRDYDEFLKKANKLYL